jgi:phenylalanyl-tRNA synthetase alpha chain
VDHVDQAAAQQRLDAELERARVDVPAAVDLAALAEVERVLVGKRSALTEVQETIKDLPPEARPAVGQAVAVYRSEVRDLVETRRKALASVEAEARITRDALDVTLPPRGRGLGHLHLVTQVTQELEDVFCGLGFQVSDGPEVETDWYNFTALNMPDAHPARSMFDTLYVRLGSPEEVLLRTHTSPVQIRVMESRTPPIYTVMPGRVYRRDTLDARHAPVFHQIEGLVVDEGITFADMAGTIEAFTRTYFGPSITSRLRPSFFPFTEPSAEFEVTCIFCEGAGCTVCSQTGWIELGGCGMVDPEVFHAVGYDPERYTGFAFGFGLDRMAMIRFGVDHVKAFWENDLRVLQQF